MQRDLVHTHYALKTVASTNNLKKCQSHKIKGNNITHFPILLPLLSRLPFLSIFTCSIFFTNSIKTGYLVYRKHPTYRNSRCETVVRYSTQQRTASPLQFLNYLSIQIIGLRDSSVGTVTKLRIGRSLLGSRKNCISFPTCPDGLWGPMCTAASLLGRKSGRNVMLSTLHCLVPRLRMGGPRTSWRAQGQIYL
jgi:hypothetical protein